MTGLVEPARAKINLTLSVCGRRSDGYHALLSLVAFAGVGDRVTLLPGGTCTVSVTGPFAAAIAGENLLDRTLAMLQAGEPRLTLGSVMLEKNLPVAAGIGGGSADAAALLRAVRRANPEFLDRLDWPSFAQRLGADVPVCLAGQATWMSGTGERLHPLATPLPSLSVVLVNPQVPVPAGKTARVFRLLGAPPLSDADAALEPACPAVSGRAGLMSLLARTGNDLEAPATAVVPEIANVLDALEACPGIEITRLSGAGPTCFGVFADDAAADAAAERLRARHPGWWIVATAIG